MSSTRQERLQHVCGLHRSVLDLVRMERPVGNITIDGERKRYYEFVARDLYITVMRAFPIDPASITEMSTLKVSFEGRTVLHIRWCKGVYDIVTFKPGKWENKLIVG